MRRPALPLARGLEHRARGRPAVERRGVEPHASSNAATASGRRPAAASATARSRAPRASRGARRTASCERGDRLRGRVRARTAARRRAAARRRHRPGRAARLAEQRPRARPSARAPRGWRAAAARTGLRRPGADAEAQGLAAGDDRLLAVEPLAQARLLARGGGLRPRRAGPARVDAQTASSAAARPAAFRLTARRDELRLEHSASRRADESSTRGGPFGSSCGARVRRRMSFIRCDRGTAPRARERHHGHPDLRHPASPVDPHPRAVRRPPLAAEELAALRGVRPLLPLAVRAALQLRADVGAPRRLDLVGPLRRRAALRRARTTSSPHPSARTPTSSPTPPGHKAHGPLRDVGAARRDRARRAARRCCRRTRSSGCGSRTCSASAATRSRRRRCS